MPKITFTEDVTLESESPETGPHYRKGYCVDVPQMIAQKWISKGAAVLGEVTLETAAPAATQDAGTEEEAASEVRRDPLPRRRKRGWSPVDEGDV